MKHPDDLPRLRDESESSASLVEALERSAQELPTTQEMADLASSLSAALPAGAMERPQSSPEGNRRSRPMRKFVAGSAASFKLLLAAVVGAFGVGALIWRMQVGGSESTAPRLVAPPSETRLGPSGSGEAPGNGVEPPQVTPNNPMSPENAAPKAHSFGEKAPVPEETSKTERGRVVENGLPTGAAAFPDSGRSSEIALLNQAHRSLAGDPRAALSLAEEHAREFPNGALAQEREFIAIQALLGLGRQSEALARADRFRARFPGSAHIRRLDILFGTTEKHAPE